MQKTSVFILGLLSVTALVLWGKKQPFFEQSIAVHQHNDFRVFVRDDQVHQGASRAKLLNHHQGLTLECDIQPSSYPWPYCEMILQYTGDATLDLSRFDRFELVAHYLEPTDATVRLQVRSFNPAYSQEDQETSWKYNGVEYRPETGPMTIPLHSFQVLSWWIADNRVPIELAGTEFKDVRQIEIATGNNMQPGRYQLHVESMVLKGQWYSDQLIYFILVCMWVLASIGFLVVRLFSYATRLHQSKQQEAQLTAINRLLNIQKQSGQARDSLTGALNRSGLKGLFLEGQEQQSNQLSLILMDLDRFAKVNELHGREVGDVLLEEFVSLISHETRESDVLVRWQGQQFMLGLMHTPLYEASTLAHKLHQYVSQHTWAYNIPLSCTFAVAQIGQESIEEFIDRCQNAMDKAKAQGRDQVFVAE